MRAPSATSRSCSSSAAAFTAEIDLRRSVSSSSAGSGFKFFLEDPSEKRLDPINDDGDLANEGLVGVEGVAIALRWWLVNEKDQWNGGGPTHVSFRPRRWIFSL